MDRIDSHMSKLSNLIEKQIDRLIKPKASHSHGHHVSSDESRAHLFRFNETHHNPSRHVKIPHNACPGREVKVTNVEKLGDVISQNTRVKRDLGFQGKLGDYVILSYGDNMFRDEDGTDKLIGMTCNAAGIACKDPTQVFDPLLDEQGKFPCCLLRPSEKYGEDCSEYALGITNIIETTHGEGLVYFLLNHRPNSINNIIGAGVATVTLSDTSPIHTHTQVSKHNSRPTLHAHRPSKLWWDGTVEPWYGDICSLRVTTAHTDYIYAYGHAKDNLWIYLCRARTDLAATDLNAYEYWNGKTWQRQRLTSTAEDEKNKLGEAQAVFWQIQQGQVVWSNYHSCFIFVYCDAWWSRQVLIKTSMSPEGPWSEPTALFEAELVEPDGGCIYSAIPHPYYDESGKTLVITFTNHPNTIQAIKVAFE